MFKRYFLVCASIFVVANLIGCAKIFPRVGYEQAAKPVSNKSACESATVLITDLKRPPWFRNYMLPDGRACPVLCLKSKPYKS